MAWPRTSCWRLCLICTFWVCKLPVTLITIVTFGLWWLLVTASVALQAVDAFVKGDHARANKLMEQVYIFISYWWYWCLEIKIIANVLMYFSVILIWLWNFFLGENTLSTPKLLPFWHLEHQILKCDAYILH